MKEEGEEGQLRACKSGASDVAARCRPDKQRCTESSHPLFPPSLSLALSLVLLHFPLLVHRGYKFTTLANNCRALLDRRDDPSERTLSSPLSSFYVRVARHRVVGLIGSAQSEGFANFVKSSLRLFTANFLGFWMRRSVALNISLRLSLRISRCQRFVNLLRRTPRAIYVLF